MSFRSTPAIVGTALSLLLLSSGYGSACAGIEHQLASYTFHFFSDVDRVSVSSHYLRYDLQMDNSLEGVVQLNHETVVVPAVDAPVGSPEAVDAITTASRPISSLQDAFTDFVKVRNEIQGNLDYKHAQAGYYVSNESDYYAQMVWTNYNRDFFDKNLNLAVGLNYAWDRIHPLSDEDTAGIAGERNTFYWSFVATQVLTPTTVLRAGIERSSVEGLQHNPYRNVYAGGTKVAERHPSERGRDDYFVDLSQYLKNRSSLKVDYRYYSDDWGVRSHTAGAKLTQYVTDKFIVRYRYRFYDQQAAYFYRDEYTNVSGIDGYLTGDYRLGSFTAHLFGGKVFWNLDRLLARFDFVDHLDLTLGYERYFNSNNFTANIFETGLEMSF